MDTFSVRTLFDRTVGAQMQIHQRVLLTGVVKR